MRSWSVHGRRRHYTEADFSAARVVPVESEGSDNYRQDEYGDINAYQEFVYNGDQHETAQTFSFPITARKAAPSRRAARQTACGGVDMITALRYIPRQARLARSLAFLSADQPPDPGFARARLPSIGRTKRSGVVRHVLT